MTEGGKVTPRLPLLNQRMYDNELESQFYMLYDSNKVLSACLVLFLGYVRSSYAQVGLWSMKILLVLVIIFVPEKYKRVPCLLKNLWMRLDLFVS